MKINFSYGNGVINIPMSAVTAVGSAGAIELRVLLILASELPALADCTENAERLAGLAGCGINDFNAAVAFWRGAGVISVADTTPDSEKNKQDKNKTAVITGKEKAEESSAGTTKQSLPEREAKLPNYTTEELTKLLESRKGASLLIDECQKAMGQMFNPHGINIILGLSDYLKLDDEYILILITYSVRMGKKSLRYIEKTAFDLYDSGITSVAELQEHIKKCDAVAETESKLRTMLGIGARALTSKEKKYFGRWIYDYGFSVEMINKAYEITVNAGKEKIIDYMNGILERWHSDGIDTPEKADLQNEQKKAASGTASAGSFDTTDFFTAAVKRSFGVDDDEANGIIENCRN